MSRSNAAGREAPDAKTLDEALDTVLEGSYWLRALQPGIVYARVQDDCDGDTTQTIDVALSPDGDLWVKTNARLGALRFRSLGGGGMSLRVRNALLVLAEAIRRDNEARPQRQRQERSGDDGPTPTRPLGL